MENDDNRLYMLTDPDILKLLGQHLKHIRISKNFTQQELASNSGLNRTTVANIENGTGGTISTLVQLLRALEKLEILECFDPSISLSPLQLNKLQKKKKQRVRKPSDAKKAK